MRREQVVVQKWDLSCGSAALATLLVHQHGLSIQEDEIVRTILRTSDPKRIRARQGFSLLDLKKFVALKGLQADGYANLSFSDLVAMAPAIVPTRLGGYDHFVVFRGVEDGQVLLADPAWGNRSLSVARFLAAWPKRMSFVVLGPRGERGLSSLPRRGEEPAFVSPLAVASTLRRPP